MLRCPGGFSDVIPTVLGRNIAPSLEVDLVGCYAEDVPFLDGVISLLPSYATLLVWQGHFQECGCRNLRCNRSVIQNFQSNATSFCTVR